MESTSQRALCAQLSYVFGRLWGLGLGVLLGSLLSACEEEPAPSREGVRAVDAPRAPSPDLRPPLDMEEGRDEGGALDEDAAMPLPPACLPGAGRALSLAALPPLEAPARARSKELTLARGAAPLSPEAAPTPRAATLRWVEAPSAPPWGDLGAQLTPLLPAPEGRWLIWDPGLRPLPRWPQRPLDPEDRVAPQLRAALDAGARRDAIRLRWRGPAASPGAKVGPPPPARGLAGGAFAWDHLTLDRASLAAQLADPSLLWLAPVGEPHALLNEASRALVRSDALQGLVERLPGPQFLGLSGEGVLVAVMDSGVEDHADFFQYRDGARGLSRVSGALPQGDDRHGTIVAGIIAGNGVEGNSSLDLEGQLGLPFRWRGHAPEAELLSIIMPRSNRELEVPPWVSAFEEGEAQLINHSHTYGHGSYTSTVGAYDDFIARGSEGSPPRPVIFAAGNAGRAPMGELLRLHGYYSVMVSMKNALTIGAVNSNDGTIAGLSSLGPTLDGRLKPDLVAPGDRDERPRSGFSLALRELRLHHREDPALDRVWRWGEAGAWSGVGLLEEAPIEGDTLRAEEVMSGEGYRVEWRVPPEASINAEDYERLSFEIRLDHDEASPAYRLPPRWRLRWGDAEGRGFDGSATPTYDGLERGEWGRHEVRLDSERWRGPIARLRLVPVVFGSQGIWSPALGGGYGLSSGTSMAAPVVAGVSALLIERLRERGEVDELERPLLPALLRALLVESARDLGERARAPRDPTNPDSGELGSPTLPGPDFVSGYGLIDAERAVELISPPEGEARRWLTGTIEAGVLQRWRFEIPAGAPRGALRATLAWDDPAKPPMLAELSPALINDLDLALVGPGADPEGADPETADPETADPAPRRRYSPWHLAPLPLDEERWRDGVDPIGEEALAPAGRCVAEEEAPRAAEEPPAPTPDPWGEGCGDPLNNLEQVYIEEATPGRWELWLRGPQRGASPQRFAIVLHWGCGEE